MPSIELKEEKVTLIEVELGLSEEAAREGSPPLLKMRMQQTL